MDWAKIEREVQSKTASILKSRGAPLAIQSFDFETQNESSPVMNTFNQPQLDNPYISSKTNQNSALHSNSPQSTTYPSEIAILSRDIMDLKNIINYQSQKMNGMERVIRSLNELLETSSSAQNSLLERVDQFELDLHTISKYTSSSNRERSDLNIQTKTINLRLQQLEETSRKAEETYVTKQAFTQLLDTCVEQLQTVGSAAESARSNSIYFATFADTLMLSLWELKGSAPAYKLEFLSNLTPEGQKEQLTRLLRDAVGNAVQIPVSAQLDVAALSLRDALESSRIQHAKDLEELQHRYSSQMSGLESKIEHSNDLNGQLDGLLRAQKVTGRDIVSLQDRVHEMEEQKRDMSEALIRSHTSFSRLSESVSRVQGDVELAMSRISEQAGVVARLQSSLSDLSALQLDTREVQEKMKNAMVKQGLVVSDLRDQVAAGLVAGPSSQPQPQTQDQSLSQNHHEDFERAQALVLEHGQMLTRVQESVSEIGATISSLAEAQTKLQQAQQQLQHDIHHLKQTQSAAMSSVQDHAAQGREDEEGKAELVAKQCAIDIAKLTEDYQNTVHSLLKLQEDTASLRDRLDELASKTDHNQHSTLMLETDFEKVKASWTDFEARLGQTEASLSSFQDQLQSSMANTTSKEAIDKAVQVETTIFTPPVTSSRSEGLSLATISSRPIAVNDDSKANLDPVSRLRKGAKRTDSDSEEEGPRVTSIPDGKTEISAFYESKRQKTSSLPIQEAQASKESAGFNKLLAATSLPKATTPSSTSSNLPPQNKAEASHSEGLIRAAVAEKDDDSGASVGGDSLSPSRNSITRDDIRGALYDESGDSSFDTESEDDAEEEDGTGVSTSDGENIARATSGMRVVERLDLEDKSGPGIEEEDDEEDTAPGGDDDDDSLTSEHEMSGGEDVDSDSPHIQTAHFGKSPINRFENSNLSSNVSTQGKSVSKFSKRLSFNPFGSAASETGPDVSTPQTAVTGLLAGGRRGNSFQNFFSSSSSTSPQKGEPSTPLPRSQSFTPTISGPNGSTGVGGSGQAPPLASSFALATASFRANPAASQPALPGVPPGVIKTPAGAPIPAVNAAGQGRDSTSQCSFCLKRIPKLEATEHHRTCSLRMETCIYGCGARVLAIKMDKHRDTCPVYRLGNTKNDDDDEPESLDG